MNILKVTVFRKVIILKEERKTEKLPKKTNRTLFCLLLALSLSVSVFAVLWEQAQYRSDKVAYHVTFCGADLSGASAEQAKRIINAEVRERSRDVLTLSYKEQEFSYTCADLGFPLDGTMLYQAALRLGREGNFWERLRFRLHALGREIPLEKQIAVDEDKLHRVLLNLRDELDTTARNARFSIEADGSVAIIPSEKGSYLDEEKTMERIKNALCDFHSDAVALIIAENSEPGQTTADLEKMHINAALSSFTTYYSEGAANRAHNIALAASRLNGIIVPPGGSFSFNTAVGPRNYEQGFLDAVIIENGKYTDGLGGGVCQVSTTLYGAILRTELEVTARRPHSLVSSYVEPGQDAMVSWGLSDLAFVNPYDTPVLLHALWGGGALTVSIYGDSKEKKEVSVTSEITRYIPFQTETVIDKDLPDGSSYIRSSGKRGLECSVYRNIVQNDGMVTTETVSHDIYAAQKKIIVSGP